MTVAPLLILLIVQITVLGVVYHKLTSAIQALRHQGVKNSDNVISQVEALLSLHAELRPTRALPKSRGWTASPDLLAQLVRLTHERRPVTVLECSSGFSTLVLAACVRNTGKGSVISLEHDPVFAEKTRELLRVHGLTEWANVIDAPLVPLTLVGWEGSWYSTGHLPSNLSVDMLVVDGPPHDTSKLARFPAVPMLARYFSANAVVVLDDALREGEAIAVERWLSSNSKLQKVHAELCEKGCAILEYRS